MKMLKVLEVRLWDGGERHNFAYFLDASTNSKTEIEKTIKHAMVFDKVLQIFDSLQDVETNKPANIKRQALAKLTDLEKQVLGLKD